MRRRNYKRKVEGIMREMVEEWYGLRNFDEDLLLEGGLSLKERKRIVRMVDRRQKLEKAIRVMRVVLKEIEV